MPALPLPCTLLLVFPFLQNKVFFLHVDQQQKKRFLKAWKPTLTTASNQPRTSYKNET